MNDEVLLKEVRQLAKQAGEVIRDIYQHQTIKIIEKQDGSPLTQADLAAQKVIAEGLARLTPDIPLVSEEKPLDDWQQRQQWRRHWLVDPLDGTKEFVARTDEFTVNIALIEQGEPILGVVDVPMLDTSYAALKGHGARRYRHGQEQLIRVRQLGSPVVLVASRRNKKGRNALLVQQLEQQLGQIERLDVGSSLKICRVAEGSADIYPRFGPTCEWDTGAADAVLREAGGSLVNTQFQPLRYNKESILNPEFVVLADLNEWQFLPNMLSGLVANT